MSIDVRSPTRDDRLRQRVRPDRRRAMHQTWSNLLFLHWRVEPDRVQRTLPPGLYVDTHQGSAYVGIVPFFMRNIRPRGLPAVPWLSNFLELNVRTYVHDARGTPAVWFYSLDCNQPLAVWGARTFFHLPYRHAHMAATFTQDGTIDYRSQVGARWTELTYRLHGSPAPAREDTFEFFLVERYLLFSRSPRGRFYSGLVCHQPYGLVDVSLDRWSSDLFVDHDWGVDESRPDHVCGSPGVDVDVYGLVGHDVRGAGRPVDGVRPPRRR